MSGKPTLAIATKSTSPSSFSTWLALKHAGADFDDVVIDSNAKDARQQILAVSPSGRLPSLSHDGLFVWEAFAICEYVVDAFAPTFWPTQRAARAYARAVAMEACMSFTDLRRVCPMNLRLEPTFGLTLPPAIGGDVLRTNSLWRECRTRYGEGGPFLFGTFTIADAMFAPIASIYATYGIPSDDVGNKYLDTLLSLPAVNAYRDQAKAERDSPAPTHRETSIL